MSRKNIGVLNCLPENQTIGYKRNLVNTFPSYDSLEKLELTVLKSEAKKGLSDIFIGIQKQILVLVEDRDIETFATLNNISENEASHICEVVLYIKNLT